MRSKDWLLVAFVLKIPSFLWTSRKICSPLRPEEVVLRILGEDWRSQLCWKVGTLLAGPGW